MILYNICIYIYTPYGLNLPCVLFYRDTNLPAFQKGWENGVCFVALVSADKPWFLVFRTYHAMDWWVH